MLEHRERLAYLRDAVERLPERLRAVVEGYFFAERPMAELAAELGVTESRISQLRAEAVALLKDALNSALDPHLVTEHARPTGCAARRREAYFAEVASHRTFAARLAPAPYEIHPHNASGSRRSGRSLLRHGPWTGRSRPTQGGKIMGLRINQNIAAMNAYRNLSVTDGQMSKSLEKLSSGFRINRAADDAAGLAISEGLRAQTGGLKVAVRNAQDGVSVVQTAEGALTETHSILQRMRDLAVQASNEGSQGTDAQAAANTEYQALALELDDIANKTTFNGTALLDGTYDKAFQVGANSGEQLQVTIGDMKAATILTAVGDLTTTATAQTALDNIDTAIETVSTERAGLGAVQNRLEHKINNLNVAVENLSASESRIRDTDMASEMVAFTRSQILSQAGTAMLAQANQAPQGVLRLLQ